MTPEAGLRAALAALHPGGLPQRVGLAVSGGGDSMALAALMEAEARARGGIALRLASVDHGLRAGSAAEAAFVADWCAERGLAHRILRWEGHGGGGNLQAAAREGRARLLAGWARDEGLAEVMTGHTRDDRAETVLMRLARGSGVDGLAALPPRARRHGIAWTRPLLALSRADLRAWNRARGVPWIEDPSNEDPRFDRVRARRALAVLGDLGLSPGRLAETAERMAGAREALERMTAEAARAHARLQAGDVLLCAAGLAALPSEIRLRLVAHALLWVTGRPYRPRLASLQAALAETAAGRAATLHGCLLTPERGRLRIGREPRAVAARSAPPDGLWDGRWRLEGPAAPEGAAIRATGAEGLARLPGWREAGLPRATLLAAPALWAGGRLVAAPLAGAPAGWAATLDRGEAAFHRTIFAD